MSKTSYISEDEIATRFSGIVRDYLNEGYCYLSVNIDLGSVDKAVLFEKGERLYALVQPCFSRRADEVNPERFLFLQLDEIESDYIRKCNKYFVSSLFHLGKKELSEQVDENCAELVSVLNVGYSIYDRRSKRFITLADAAEAHLAYDRAQKRKEQQSSGIREFTERNVGFFRKVNTTLAGFKRGAMLVHSEGDILLFSRTKNVKRLFYTRENNHVAGYYSLLDVKNWSLVK